LTSLQNPTPGLSPDILGLDPGRFAEVGFLVGSSPAVLTIIPGVLDDLTYPIKFLPDHDLAHVVLLVGIITIFALVDILAHVFPP